MSLTKQVEILERNEARYQQALFDIINKTTDLDLRDIAILAIYPNLYEKKQVAE